MFGIRQKTNSNAGSGDTSSQSGIGDNLGALREKGDDLLSAADDAIDRGLSGESHKFVTNVRQASGE